MLRSYVSSIPSEHQYAAIRSLRERQTHVFLWYRNIIWLGVEKWKYGIYWCHREFCRHSYFLFSKYEQQNKEEKLSKSCFVLMLRYRDVYKETTYRNMIISVRRVYMKLPSERGLSGLYKCCKGKGRRPGSFIYLSNNGTSRELSEWHFL